MVNDLTGGFESFDNSHPAGSAVWALRVDDEEAIFVRQLCIGLGFVIFFSGASTLVDGDNDSRFVFKAVGT